jgi:hypothetical protein
MNTKAESNIVAWVSAIDNKFIRIINRVFISITREVPHHHLIALANLLTLKLNIARCSSTHMSKRRLPANNLGHLDGINAGLARSF